MYQSGFGYPSVVRPAYQPYAPSYGHPLAASYNPYASFASPAVIPRPLYNPLAASVVQPTPTVKGESRVEYLPYQKNVIEYEEQQQTIHVPKVKQVTDYYPVEYQKEYIPQYTLERQVEYVPQEKYVPRVDYQEIERQVYPAQQSPLYSSYVQPVQHAYPAYAAPSRVLPSYPYAYGGNPLTQSYARPLTSSYAYPARSAYNWF